MNKQIEDEGLTCAYLLGKSDGYQQGRADVIEECIKKLAETKDAILSDRQYYTLVQIEMATNVITVCMKKVEQMQLKE